MATTSSIDLPSTDHTDATFPEVASVAVAWVVWGAQVLRWAVTDARVEFRAVHLIPAGFAAAVLLTAAYGLGLSA